MWKCYLKQIIESSRFEEEEIAEKLEITIEELRRYEKFEEFMPMEKALILADMLNYKVDDFYERVEEPNILEEPIEVLELPTRIYNILKRNGIHTVGKLLEVGYDLIDIGGLGSASITLLLVKISEIKKKLSEDKNEDKPASTS
jgi:DNA-directed RNA polymerase alpha subunit